MYTIKRNYRNHYGLNLKRNDLTRPMPYATVIRNARYRSTSSIDKRPGFQGHGATQGGYGLVTYNRKNALTGADEAETLTVGRAGLSRQLFSELTVTYSGALAPVLFSVVYDTTTEQYRCQITEGSTQVLDFALGMPYDVASPVTLNDLATQINALSGFAAAITGSTSTPAAFLKVYRDYELDGALTVAASYWEAVNTTVTNPFDTYHSHRNDADFENMSTAQLQNLLYLSGGGYDYVHKYDGQTLFRAGLPTPASLVAAIGGAGAITGNNYLYKIQYVQYDAAGGITESNLLATSNVLSPAAQNIDLTVANVLAGTGFNTNCAVVNGAQVGVNTITVDAAHTMKVGDTAYFYDAVGSAHVEREVTAVGATTVTVAGAVVNVADNAVISNNLRIAIYRSKTSGSTPTVWYLHSEIPNNSFSATQAIVDSTLDAAMLSRLVPPVTDRSAPPNCKYLAEFQGQLIASGAITSPRTVYWSDIDGPEYFPADSNSQDMESSVGDGVQGMAANNEVFAIFTGRTTTIMSGDLANNALRFELRTSDVGCLAHQTIQDVRGVLHWLSDKGPMKMAGGSMPTPLGEEVDEETGRIIGGRIDPIMEQSNLSEEQRFNFRRAIAFNDTRAKHYLLCLPAETSTGGENWSNANTATYVFDYDRGAWLLWSNFDFTAGMTMLGDEVYFQRRKYSSFASAVNYVLFRRFVTDTADSYQDDNEPVEMDYGTGWEHDGHPYQDKKFTRLLLYIFDETENNSPTLTIEQEVDFIKDSPLCSMSFSLDGGGYGVAGYGTAPYGNASAEFDDRKLGQGKYKAIRFRFKNEEPQQNCIITGWDLEMVVPYRPKAVA